MAEAVVKRLAARKIVEIKDEAAARAAIRAVVVDHLRAEEQLETDARRILTDQLLGKVKEKLARDRGFVL